MKSLPRFSVRLPWPSKYGSVIDAVPFSTMPSHMSFTLVGA